MDKIEKMFLFEKITDKAPFNEIYEKKESELSDEELQMLLLTAIKDWEKIIDKLPNKLRIRFLLQTQHRTKYV